MTSKMIDRKAFEKACAAWDHWMSQPNKGVSGGLLAAIEAYESAKRYYKGTPQEAARECAGNE